MKKLMVFIIIAAAMMCLTGCDCEQQRVASLAMSSNQLTVHFNANGGSGTMDDMKVTFEKTATLPPCKFTPPLGKKFDHWNNASDGSGELSLPDCGSYTVPRMQQTEATLYAIWSDAAPSVTPPIEYTIHFDANGGSGTMADITSDESKNVYLPDCTFTPPAGKKFGHWNTKADDSGHRPTNGARWVTLKSGRVTEVTLYAIWIDEEIPIIIYTIHFDANGGSGTMADMTADSEQSVPEPGCTFTPPIGKQFAHWSTKADDTGFKFFSPGLRMDVKCLPEPEATLYAIWKYKEGHNIYYIDTKNAGNPNEISFRESDTIVLQDISADGFTFVGWYDAATDGNKIDGWSAGEYMTNVTLWARWSANVYSITYKDEGNMDFSGELGSDYPTDHTYDIATYLVMPTKVNYDFDGWFMQPDCTGERVAVLSANDVTSDITLYAKWILHPYVIHYKNLGNGTNPNPTTFTIEDDMTFENSVRDGYAFDGWYDYYNFDTANLVIGWEAGDVTTDLYLYAKWTAKEYQVTLKDGDTTVGIITATYDRYLPYLSYQMKPKKNGYSFGGYSTLPNGSGDLYIDKNGSGYRKWDMTSDATLYASFIENGAHQIIYTNPISNNAQMPFSGTFKETDNVTINNSISADGYTFLGWYNKATGGSRVTGWNAGEKKADVTLYARWTGVNNDGNFVIENETFPSSLVQVMQSPVTVVGSDDNWNSYCRPDYEHLGNDSVYSFHKGVFISGRTVKLSPYRIGKYEVTQELYIKVMNCSEQYHPANNNINNPVEYINWYRAIVFCNKLSILMGKTPCYSLKIDETEIDWAGLEYSSIPYDINGTNDTVWDTVTVNMNVNGYRLPTEAEWEFAARGGDPSNPVWRKAFNGDDTYGNVAWYSGNHGSSAIYPHIVGQKLPNVLGLYDILGNVAEWCWDWYENSDVTINDDAYRVNGIVTDPLGLAASSSYYRCTRGGEATKEAWTVSERSFGKPIGYGLMCGIRLVQSVR